ncbi:hypothetical protein T11_7807 [Trichinella zimbabwensis]|uniref:Uncharacterized protein n=1 Tax=Trichinella zimbabwensis TaxID=268475 RepID=A0A0V1H743_9BILA|nr:hypothetical protein T11_7807 [Trichinella zimbabwensis]
MLTTVGTCNNKGEISIVQCCARDELNLPSASREEKQQQQQQHVFLFVDLKNHCKPAGAKMPALLYTNARLAAC